ncbi:hypothetical protein EDD17DRAFT_1618784 [Pisolithus thermaeus]|nr:hypothetical protein EDD17DRAFT_1618784 [Pisolithus thermaeus]
MCAVLVWCAPILLWALLGPACYPVLMRPIDITKLFTIGLSNEEHKCEEVNYMHTFFFFVAMVLSGPSPVCVCDEPCTRFFVLC